jgi:hypothetical protein
VKEEERITQEVKMKTKLDCQTCPFNNCGCDDPDGQMKGGCVIPWEEDNGPVEMTSETHPETQEVKIERP